MHNSERSFGGLEGRVVNFDEFILGSPNEKQAAAATWRLETISALDSRHRRTGKTCYEMADLRTVQTRHSSQ